LHAEFQLQIKKKWEDSAMLLARDKQQNKAIRKNRKTQQIEKDSTEDQRPNTPGLV
jgi:hypothetical protein